MKKHIVLFVALLFNLFCFADNNTIIPNKMTNNIIITIDSQEKYLLGGAIPVLMTIKNNSKDNIEILLPYPDLSSLSFDSESSLLKIKEKEISYGGRVVPTRIKAGGTYQLNYFLNRYFYFFETGVSKVVYTFYATVSVENSITENVTYKGDFVLNMEKSTESELNKQFADYSNKLESSDTQIQKEAVEALTFIETPLCVTYVIPILSVKNMEVKGIKILSRFPSLESKKAIAKMLSHTDSNVVFEAIKALKVNNVIIPRSKFIDMLSSPNASIRLIGLGNLESSPDISDEGKVKVLRTDINEIVAERANNYYQLLLKTDNSN